MSDFKNNNGFGQLFPNTYKTPGDNKPDYRGKFTDLAGDEWDIAAWEKEGRNGPFLSLGIQVVYVKPEDRGGDKRPTPKPIGGDSPPTPEDFDDDIPF